MYLLLWLAACVCAVRAQKPGPWSSWDYCDKDVKCKDLGTSHTVCDRNNECGPVKDCTEYMTDGIRDLMVRLHNVKRNFVALGKHKGHYLPSSSNMRALSYDYSLEYTIRCHINRCTGTEHDVCRGTKRWVQVSQNLCGHTMWDSTKSLDQNIEEMCRLCVDLWFNESYYAGADFKDIIGKYDTLDVPQGSKLCKDPDFMSLGTKLT